MVDPNFRWNVLHQAGILHRTGRMARSEDMNFISQAGEVFGKAEGALYADPTLRREEIRNNENLAGFRALGRHWLAWDLGWENHAVPMS